VTGETVDTAELPFYPAMGTVATEDDERVYVKIVNFADSAEPVEITLDCDVEADYTVGLLTGNATDENSLEDPVRVSDTVVRGSGASRAFTYTAPALSVSVLELVKR
jgi:alpha-L-arabinofuranosidase